MYRLNNQKYNLMNTSSHFPRYCLLGASIALVGAPFVQAQQGKSLDELVSQSLIHMKNNRWEQALADLTAACSKPNIKTLYGSKIGVLFYRKGICELRLNQFAEAKASFETCYRDFPSDKDGGGNIYHKMALLKGGDAALGAEEFEEAVRMYKKFLAERSTERGKDTYQRGPFHINLCICYFKLGKLPEGMENLEIAIKNKEVFPTPDAAIVAGFQAFVNAAIEKNNEQSILDFIAKNRAEITIEPFEMQEYNRLFLKLAHDAYGAQMLRASIVLYQMIVPSEVTLEDVKVRRAMIGSRRGVLDGTRMISADKLKASEEAVTAMIRESKQPEITQLLAMAYIHEINGNVRGAFASYENLELYYPKHAKRENNLFQLVRTSSVVGEVLTTEKYGQIFLKNFPSSEHVPAVRRMMLTSLFYEGEYKKCIEVATVIIEKLEKNTEQHDICLHVLGGSYYYEGEYEKAQPFLNDHVTQYPQSKFRQAALFFQGSNMAKLQEFVKAAVLLDAFLKEYPDPGKNLYLPFALYDRANCHYAESEYAPALEKLNRLETEFPNTEVLDLAFNLKGNVLLAENKRDEAETYYKKGFELSERRGATMVSSESVYLLIAMLGEKMVNKEPNPRIKDAVPWIDKFWKEYADGSPYRTQAAVAGIYAMDAVERGEEGLERLRDVIAEMASDPMATGLEEAIGSYTEFYLTKHSPDELKEHYYNFPKIQAKDMVARALLRMAVIGVFEEEIKKAKDDAQRGKAEAMVKVLFSELKSAEFSPKDLTSFILVRVGDFIREKTGAPRESLDYYTEALSRKDGGYKAEAMFGRADVLGRSTAAADLDIAIKDLTEVLAIAEKKTQKERALYRIITLHAAKGEWSKVNEQGKIYLDRKTNNYNTYASDVSLLLAQSYEKTGAMNDAISVYSSISFGNNRGTFKYSAIACKRYMELLWERDAPGVDGKPNDKQGAYNAGYLYIDSTRVVYQKNPEEDREVWHEVENLVKEYEARPGIKSYAQLKKEMEQ
jgi:tetratricopeptide (TPR) repeat protein